MRLVTFYPRDSFPLRPRIGTMLDEWHVVDLAAAYRAHLLISASCDPQGAIRIAEALLPASMVTFLEGGQVSRGAALEAFRFARRLPAEELCAGEKLTYPLQTVQLLAPVPRPPCLRDFIAFEAHIQNTRRARGLTVPPEWYELPVYYKGNPASVVGPDAEITPPQGTQQMDYELEFAAVIGMGGTNITVAEAEDHIAGYMIMNDFSARDLQFKEVAVGLGPAKGKDFATATGPWLVTKDELPNPYNLRMIARVNGQIWSDGNSATMSRKFPELVAYASRNEPLMPGDVLGSGTVGGGCGLELGQFLNAGDLVELEIEGLGILSNRIASS